MENNDPPTYQQVAQAKAKNIHFYHWTNYRWEEMSDIAPIVPGDVNGDGVVTSADITALYDFLLNNDTTHIVNGDQTGDGDITAADITAVYGVLLTS
jgi:hypothetical protein